MSRPSVIPILDLLDTYGITQVTFEAHQFDEEYALSPDDKDFVTFHKNTNPPYITDKLQVCDVETTSEPIHNDWYISINYHS